MYIYTSCASVCLYLNKRLNTQFVVTDSPYLLTEHHGVPYDQFIGDRVGR